MAKASGEGESPRDQEDNSDEQNEQDSEASGEERSEEEDDQNDDSDNQDKSDDDDEEDNNEDEEEEQQEKESEEDLDSGEEGNDERNGRDDNNEDSGKDLSYSEKQLKKAMIGDLDSEFPENVKVVRIFTSSTFTGICIGKLFSYFLEGNNTLESVWLSQCKFPLTGIIHS